MTRDTSIDAYHAIQENGLLGRRQWQIYDVLYRHGPLTYAGVCNFLQGEMMIHISPHGLGSRFSELREMGVIKEIGQEPDPVTKMTVLVYDVTSGIPEKKNKWKKSKKEIIEELNAELARAKSLLARCRCKIQDELPF